MSIHKNVWLLCVQPNDFLQTKLTCVSISSSQKQNIPEMPSVTAAFPQGDHFSDCYHHKFVFSATSHLWDSSTLLRFIKAAELCRSSFMFIAFINKVPLCGYAIDTIFIYPIIDSHFYYFLFWSIMTKVALNMSMVDTCPYFCWLFTWE